MGAPVFSSKVVMPSQSQLNSEGAGNSEDLTGFAVFGLRFVGSGVPKLFDFCDSELFGRRRFGV